MNFKNEPNKAMFLTLLQSLTLGITNIWLCLMD